MWPGLSGVDGLGCRDFCQLSYGLLGGNAYDGDLGTHDGGRGSRQLLLDGHEQRRSQNALHDLGPHALVEP